MTTDASAFVASRDFIVKHRINYDTATRDFRWPVQEHFNWALDYFDVVAAGNHRPALHIVEEDGREAIRSFAELSAASNRVANFLRGLGATRGDCLLLMLGNDVALWETLLAAKAASACRAESYRCHPAGASPTAILVNVPLTPSNFATSAAAVTTWRTRPRSTRS